MPSCILCDYMLCIHCESHSLFTVPSLESCACHSLYCTTGSYHKATLTLQGLKSFFFFSRWFLVLTFSTYLHPAEQRCCKYVVADWKGICLTCDGRSEHLCVCMYVCVRERVAWWLRSLAREIILNAKEFQGCVLLSCAVCSRLTMSTRLWIQKIS